MDYGKGKILMEKWVRDDGSQIHFLFLNGSSSTLPYLPPPTEAVKVANGVVDLNRAGPLVEYERRIAAGELVDGDACQVGTLRELQRLYDELVESADACKLDRSAAFEKGGRSRWLWSRFMPHRHTLPLKVYTCMEESAREKPC